MTDRRDHTRAAIVEAATRLMGAHGVRAVTVEQIAKEAYVSVGAIYTHFAGKDGLAMYFVDAGLTALEERVREAWELESPIERVHAVGDAFFCFAVDHPIAARFAAVRVLDPDPSPEFVELNDSCARRMRPVVLGVARDVRAAMAAGQMQSAPIDEAVTYLWAAWNGAAALTLRRDEFAIDADTGQRAIGFGRALLEASAPRSAGAGN